MVDRSIDGVRDVRGQVCLPPPKKKCAPATTDFMYTPDEIRSSLLVPQMKQAYSCFYSTHKKIDFHIP